MTRSADRAQVASLIAERLGSLEEGRSLDPTELARAIAGSDEKRWRLLMPAIRDVAVGLAETGSAIILRKGRPVDPRDFKGIYRIGRAAEEKVEA
ncbi:MAG: DUF3253 domain-containing protein [Bosea sp.]|nr:DUF3253 domain-containing protein [Bosea sp. (in: a-proteobacteria)]